MTEEVKSMLDKNAVYEVVIYSTGDTKSGTKMGKLQVKNLNDNSVLNCIMWEETINRIDEKYFRSGNKIKIVKGTFNPQYNNCLVSEIELLEEAVTGLSTEAQEHLYNKICERVTRFQEEKLRTFIADVLTENEEMFKVAPAAKVMHHNYSGGLLQHSFECMEIADKIAEMFPKKIDRDELVAASIIHDLGKIYEYNLNQDSGIIDYSEDFRNTWISHSQWGFTKCMVAGFPKIARMIAAHHGRTDWGAMIDLSQKELEPYVYALHHVDDISAKFGKTNISDL